MTPDAPEDLTARERIEAHRLAREADELANTAPWAAWILRPLARLIRWMDTELERDRRERDSFY
jgi:hypothetical protein